MTGIRILAPGIKVCDRCQFQYFPSLESATARSRRFLLPDITKHPIVGVGSADSCLDLDRQTLRFRLPLPSLAPSRADVHSPVGPPQALQVATLLLRCDPTARDLAPEARMDPRGSRLSASLAILMFVSGGVLFYQRGCDFEDILVRKRQRERESERERERAYLSLRGSLTVQ